MPLTCAVTIDIRTFGMEPNVGATVTISDTRPRLGVSDSALILFEPKSYIIPSSGVIVVDIRPGPVLIEVSGQTATIAAKALVPDQETASIADWLDAAETIPLSASQQAVVDARAARDAAELFAGNAGDSATAAAASEDVALDQAAIATGAAGTATGAMGEAEDARDLAKDYANKAEDSEVTPGFWSAFHWMRKARLWAIQSVGVPVADGLFSAFHWAAQSANSATSAAASSAEAASIAADIASLEIALTGINEIYVEAYRTPGLSDGLTIDAALADINARGLTGAILKFEPRREYVIDTTPSLRLINFLTLDGQGARMKRANASVTNSTLAANTATTTATITVTSRPANWRVGDTIVPITGTQDTKAATPRRITAMSGNTISLNAPWGSFDGYNSGNPIPAGTKVIKVFNMFVGRPSSTDSASVLAAGINRGIKIKNFEFDGNGANQESNSWRLMAEFGIHSEGGEISGCYFHDTAGECIVGHGLHVHHNTFIDLAGSAFHTSMNDQSVASSSLSSFTKNFVKNTNTAGNVASGHSEGAITFSWGAGRLIVANNEFRGGAECLMGGVDSAAIANPDEWFVFQGNICSGYVRLFYSVSTATEGIIIADNILHDCGNNAAILNALNVNNSVNVSGNVVLGNTVLGGMARDVRQSIGTNPNVDLHLAAVQWLRGHAAADDTGVTATTHTGLSQVAQVVERSTAALTAYVTNDAGYAGQSYFNPASPSATGGAMDFYDAATASMFHRIYNNAGGHRWQNATGQDLLRLFHNKPLELRGSVWGLGFYDSDVSGNWAIAPTASTNGDLGFYVSTGVGTRALRHRFEPDGDVVLTTAARGIIVTSPNGLTTRRIGIDNAGNVVATTV